ncbi:MAG: hypothetical protein M1834_008145 [Cirrosporium novae-zelandiae]|nr:MAG: hypothetical protein M1834_008145 [Cirrosporium novae-zelandiae]
MGLLRIPPTLITALYAFLTLAPCGESTPFPKQLIEDAVLVERGCVNPCGWYSQVCCGSSSACYTNTAGEAACSAAATSYSGNGAWTYYTTTYVETDLVTITSTYSSYVATATYWATSSATPSCDYSLNQTPCGSICCAGNQYCETAGQCKEGEASTESSYTAPTTGTYSAPLRPTTGVIVTVTSTGSATTTEAFITPVSTNGSLITGEQTTSSGLSGGAIAGIVIGVIVGIILLLLLCACLCFRELLVGLFGGGKKKRTTTETIVESRYSSHHSGSWYGSSPSRVDRPKKKTGAGMAGAFGGLAALLGLKRKKDQEEEKSSYYGYGSTYYSSDYTTSMQARMIDERDIHEVHEDKFEFWACLISLF